MANNGFPAPSRRELDRLFMDAIDLADNLLLDKVEPDCLVTVLRVRPEPGFLGRVGMRESRLKVEDAWDLDGCEAAGIRAMALHTSGRIYINPQRPLERVGHWPPVMRPAYRLSEAHFKQFARVHEIRERLGVLAAAHAPATGPRGGSFG